MSKESEHGVVDSPDGSVKPDLDLNDLLIGHTSSTDIETGYRNLVGSLRRVVPDLVLIATAYTLYRYNTELQNIAQDVFRKLGGYIPL